MGSVGVEMTARRRRKRRLRTASSSPGEEDDAHFACWSSSQCSVVVGLPVDSSCTLPLFHKAKVGIFVPFYCYTTYRTRWCNRLLHPFHGHKQNGGEDRKPNTMPNDINNPRRFFWFDCRRRVRDASQLPSSSLSARVFTVKEDCTVLRPTRRCREGSEGVTIQQRASSSCIEVPMERHV